MAGDRRKRKCTSSSKTPSPKLFARKIAKATPPPPTMSIVQIMSLKSWRWGHLRAHARSLLLLLYSVCMLQSEVCDDMCVGSILKRICCSDAGTFWFSLAFFFLVYHRSWLSTKIAMERVPVRNSYEHNIKHHQVELLFDIHFFCSSGD